LDYDQTTSGPAGGAGDGRIAGLGALFGLLYFVQGIVEPTEGLLSQPIKSCSGTGTIPRHRRLG
jgi:hypothetical protein